MQIGNGLIVGSVYALVALGLNLIWSITDIPDFAQGSFYVLSAYTGFFAVTLLNLHYLVALLCGMSTGAALAFLCERFLYRRWRERIFRDAARVQLLVAIALFFLLLTSPTPSGQLNPGSFRLTWRARFITSATCASTSFSLPLFFSFWSTCLS